MPAAPYAGRMLALCRKTLSGLHPSQRYPPTQVPDSACGVGDVSRVRDFRPGPGSVIDVPPALPTKDNSTSIRSQICPAPKIHTGASGTRYKSPGSSMSVGDPFLRMTLTTTSTSDGGVLSSPNELVASAPSWSQRGFLSSRPVPTGMLSLRNMDCPRKETTCRVLRHRCPERCRIWPILPCPSVCQTIRPAIRPSSLVEP